MAIFDPKKARDDHKSEGVPPGPYLLAMTSFKRKESKAQKPYLGARFVIIAGPAKGKSFFDNISLDMSNSGAMFRLGILAEQCGVEAAFDLDDDEVIKQNLVGRPFKAQVSRKNENGYTNNGIERYLTGDKVSDGDRRVMEEWVTARADQDEWSGNGGGPPEDDVPHRAMGGGIDDDIPFASARVCDEPSPIAGVIRWPR